MPAHRLNELVLASNRRLGLPIAAYPGLALTGGTVHDLVTNPDAQCAAQLALHARYRTPFLLSAMDLSAEAEAFGCPVALSEAEVPTVTGRLVTSLEHARALPVPVPGTARTSVYLRAVKLLRQHDPDALVLGGCIGPFSLAARLTGVSEAMELTLTEPDMMHVLLRKSAEFLRAYGQAFQAAGADGLIMAEPAAGLLSPHSMVQFSSAYIRDIGAQLETEGFGVVLHNCAAKLIHLPAVLQSGLSTFHFGAPMDIPKALSQVPGHIVLCGNLDPTAVFCQATAADVLARARALLEPTAGFRNYVLSSGCDLPRGTKLENLDAFYRLLGYKPQGT